MYHTEPPTDDKTIREWYMNSSRVAAFALRNEQAATGPGVDSASNRNEYQKYFLGVNAACA